MGSESALESPHGGARVEAAAGDQQRAPGEEAKQLVDAASSPIQFSEAAESASEDEDDSDGAGVNVDDDDEERDFETRISSSGDAIRFECDDQRLARLLKSGSRQARKQPPLLPSCRINLPRHNNRCCGEALIVHDAECKLCNPRARQQQQQHHSAGRRRDSRPPGGCVECARLQDKKEEVNNNNNNPGLANNKPSEPDANALTGQRHEKTPEAHETSGPDANEIPPERLPILSALKPRGCLEEQTGGVSSLLLEGPTDAPSALDRQQPRKTNKKASQKLTFSDILVEKSSAAAAKSLTPVPKLDNGLNRSDINAASSRLQSGADQRGSIGAGWIRTWLGLSGGPKCRTLESDNGSTRRQPNSDEQNSTKFGNSLLRAICCSSTTSQLMPASTCKSSSSSILTSHLSLSSTKRAATLAGASRNHSSNDSTTPSSASSSSQKHSSSSTEDDNGARITNSGSSRHHHHHQHTSSSSKSSYSNSHHPIQPKSERKAAKTLSTLLLVFIATWLPYNVLVLIKTLSGGEDLVPEKIWNFSYYLCYINSTINPLCYALCNAQFRRTYMRILKCKLSNEHNSKRRLVPLQSSRNCSPPRC